MRNHRAWILVVILALVGPNSGSSGDLSYYLAVVARPAYPGAPPVKVPDGPDWIADTFTTVTGIQVPIVRRTTPEISLPMGAIERVELYRPIASIALFPSSSTVSTDLFVEPQSRAGFEMLSREHAYGRVLVFHQGRAIDLKIVTPDLADKIPGGTFPTEEEARKFYALLEDAVRIRPVPEGELNKLQDHNNAVRDWMLWHLNCDEAFRHETQQEGWDVDKLLKEAGDDVALLNCSNGPPGFPVWSEDAH